MRVAPLCNGERRRWNVQENRSYSQGDQPLGPALRVCVQ